MKNLEVKFLYLLVLLASCNPSNTESNSLVQYEWTEIEEKNLAEIPYLIGDNLLFKRGDKICIKAQESKKTTCGDDIDFFNQHLLEIEILDKIYLYHILKEEILIRGIVKTYRTKKDGTTEFETDKTAGIFDSLGKIIMEIPKSEIISSEYEYIENGIQNSSKVKVISDRSKHDPKWGLASYDDRIIIQPIFDDLSDFGDGHAAFKLGSKYGLLNESGEITIEPEYEYLSKPDKELICAQKEKNGKYGFIDTLNNLIIPYKYDLPAFFYKRDLAVITINKKQGCIDRNGMEIIPPIFDKIQTYHKDEFMIMTKDSLCGIYNNNQEKILDLKYDHIQHFGTKLFSIYKNGKEGLFNPYTKKIMIEPKYKTITTLSNGDYWDMMERKIDKTYNHELTIFIFQDNGKYGFMSDDCEIISKPIYDEIVGYSEDKICASKNGKYGVVNIKNQVVIEFKFDNLLPFLNNKAIAELDSSYGIISIN